MNNFALTTLALFAAFPPLSWATTIPFTFTINARQTLFTGGGPPARSTYNQGALTLGIGDFSPLGPGTDFEAGGAGLNLIEYPSGVFAPASPVTDDFTYSFNGGTDTLSGTDLIEFAVPDAAGVQATSNTLTILSGTGQFSGVTGLALATGTRTAPPPVTFYGGGGGASITYSGSGNITYPDLLSTPEPASVALLSVG